MLALRTRLRDRSVRGTYCPRLTRSSSPPEAGKGHPLGRTGERHTEQGEPVDPGGDSDGVRAGGGRGVTGTAGAGGSEDVRAAAHQDDASGAEGAAGRRPEHRDRPDVAPCERRTGLFLGGNVALSGGGKPPETRWNNLRLQGTSSRFVSRLASP
jgi:hypothetical protein